MVNRGTRAGQRTLAILALVLGSRLGAQATPLVPIDAAVYRDIDRFAALGLLDTMIVGIRPYSERAIVRLLTEAEANLGRSPTLKGWAESRIHALLALYRRDHLRVVDEIGVELVGLRSPARTIEPDPTGSIDAPVNPLTAYRQGRLLADGTTIGLESRHGATLGRYLAASINPRATVVDPRGGQGSVSDLRLQAGALNALFGDFAIEAGRDNVVFGQSRAGGLLLSSNAPPLDMVRVWNDRPWHVPLLSRLFGPIQGTLLVADLGGAHQIHPHARLAAYHVAGLPHPQFEIGVQVIDAMGGKGGQPASFGDRILDVIPIFDAFRTGSDFQFSNKIAGIDFRWRMPRWRGFELYFEGNADDFDGRDLARGFLEDAGYLTGVSLSCLVECGRLTARAEFHQTGIRYYTHTDYPIARNGFVLGDALGPRGLGGTLAIESDAGVTGHVSLAGTFEVRSGNQYAAETTGPDDEGFHFVQIKHRPGEKRSRLLVGWAWSDTRPLSLELNAGIERVSNFAFVEGNDRTNGLARVGVVWRPR